MKDKPFNTCRAHPAQRLALLKLFLFLLCARAYSQTDSASKNIRSIVYVEAGGAGGYASMNYENCFYEKTKLHFSWRAGLFLFHIKDFTGELNPDLTLPLSVNAFYGNRHHMELGIGQTISSTRQQNRSDTGPARSTQFNTNFTLGYRYQAKRKRLFFRAAYTPLLENNRHYRHWAGISVGYIL